MDIATGHGICDTVWQQRDQIAAALLSSALATNISGYNLDWETGTPNNVACYVKVWGYVQKKLAAHGVQLQTVSCTIIAWHLGCGFQRFSDALADRTSTTMPAAPATPRPGATSGTLCR